MHYRAATLSDLEAVLAVVEELASEQVAVGSRIDPAGSSEAFRDRLARQIVDGGVIVAEEADELVGLVTFSRLSDALTRTESVGIVQYLYVDPERRRTGIGETLLRRAEEALTDAGVAVVELEVLAENEAALAFYEANGYGQHRHRLAKPLEE